MSPQSPRPKEPSHSKRETAGGAHARALAALLALALCVPLTFAHGAPRTGQGQNPAQPAPAPNVRPRQVTPNEEPVRPASQPQATQPSAQPSQTAEEVDEDEVVRVDSNLVIIPATVLDSRGRAVVDLKVEDFELRVDGEVKPIGDVSRAETPVHIALLFDNSASLSAAREFEKQAAVRFFRSVVRPIDRAAIYSISTVPTLAQGLTNDVARLVHTIERFGAPDGATALFDAVAQAADYMRPLPGRKVLVIVSDGTDTVSDTSFEEAANRALRAECQIYVVQTRQVEEPALHDPVSEQRMQRLSEQTGGAVYVPRTVEELDAVFTQVSLDLSQQYLLSYYPQDERKDKYFRFISLRVKTRPSLRVRARKGFYPEAAKAQPSANGAGAPFSGSLASAPITGFVAAASTRNEAAPPHRRGVEVPASALDTGPSARAKPGPEGPDTDEAARPRPEASAPMPTFSMRASAPAGPPKASSPAPAAPAASEPAGSNAPAEANPTPKPPSTPASPPPAPTKEATPATPSGKAAAVDEAGEAKASGSKPSSADAGKPPEGEKAKTVMSGGVLNSKAVSLPRPGYPSAAKSVGAAGTVVVEVTIDEQGKVVGARAISGHPFLQQAAVQAARQARFSPATLSGEPVKIKGTISYVFTLP